ncbi:MAG TPA: GNAT family N-acetyltransferase [Lacipirellulaceae bacterium]|nr:GNAT family N-acetyltransferase [Lacipirellulaceae bacterium]
MYLLRPFLNSDPPRLAAIWRNQSPQRGLLQPMTAPLLEYGVFSKLHFDRQGLVVAMRDGEAAGFVHAGFGPSDDGLALDTSLGTTHVLMVDPAERETDLPDLLLAASEQYQRSRGATVCYAGGINPLNSFYLGLYGGSEIPGVLQTDALLQQTCLRNGYREIDRVRIMQCDEARVRPPVSRELRIIKRTTQVVEAIDPPAKTWWEACVWGSLQRDCFQLVEAASGREQARATFWDMQPLSACWGMSTAGLVELYVLPELRRRGYASYLFGEATRVLRRRGVSTIEAQVMASNEAASNFYSKLGFTEIDHGIVFRKDAIS